MYAQDFAAKTSGLNGKITMIKVAEGVRHRGLGRVWRFGNLIWQK